MPNPFLSSNSALSTAQNLFNSDVVNASSSPLGTDAARAEQFAARAVSDSGTGNNNGNNNGKNNGKNDSNAWLDEFLKGLNSVFGNMLSSADVANEVAKQNAASANQFAHDEAALDRAFQQYNADTYYQRQVKDLEKAGLNKWMAIYGSGGAGIPNGSHAAATNATTFRRNDSFTDSVLGVLTLFSSLMAGFSNANMPSLSDSLVSNSAKKAFASSPALLNLWKLWYNVNNRLGLIS